MSRAPKKQTDPMADRGAIDAAERRGFKDAMADTQECWLPPPDIFKPELIDAWMAGCRRAWAERKAVVK